MTLEKPLVFYSRYRKFLNPELRGGELAWPIGSKAVYTAPKSGKEYFIIIDSEPMLHDDVPGLVYEAIFEDGERFAVLADALEPRFSEKELAEIKDWLQSCKEGARDET